MDPSERKRVILINITSLLFFATIAVLAFIFFKAELYTTAWFSVFFSLSLLTPMTLNALGRPLLAAITLVLVSNVMGLVLCLLVGPLTRIHEGFYVLSGAPWLLFDMKQKKLAVMGLLLSIVGYVSVQWGPDYFQAGQLVVDTEAVIHFCSSIIFLALTSLLVYHLSRQHTIAESKIKEYQAQSIHAAKLASLGELAGGVAHEINNPLAIIKSGTEMANELLDDPVLDIKALKNIHSTTIRTVDRMAKIIVGLRAFARDGSRDKLEPFSVQELIKDTITLCGEKFYQKQIDVRTLKVDPELTVLVRKTEICQVLLNLLNNSFDAILDKPEKWIEISARASNGAVEISVRDSGNGIPEKVRHKIFQPFFTTKEIGKGTGLGLSISDGLVKSHGGEIYVNPNDTNTCFIIRLPRHISPVKNDLKKAS